MYGHHLSQLSFLNTAHISSNIQLIKDIKGITTDKSSFEVMTILLETPNNCFSSDSRHQLVIENNLSYLKFILSGLMGGIFPDSFEFINKTIFDKQVSLAIKAEEIWSEKFPNDYSIYNTLIGRVLYAYRDLYSGGSVSNAIGFIWLSPEEDWDEMNYLENLIHEYVHNILFLEEMTNSLFSISAAEMAKPENCVISAIRRVPRYFDQAYHAAAVAIVLAELSVFLNKIDNARLYLDGVIISLNELKNKKEIMSTNGYNLLKEMISVSLNIYENIYSLSKAS
ncbi:HEXXH motif-containing putative peptide modification protein [Acinetobacter sp. C26M]|uniref:aKG-HExxH-type peptide beta-hydroxylase n=1 Tax=unclassified Acinetobacter TaxID=196816 RepID=UPI00203756B0|nr:MULTISPECIES: HEXXH motif-containing putative peptide modification protein [unclassified Acinetobacter]USA47223.1 HEXXH motif-containing putative peptide modification protein [Acinetobacter sp. C26M]USA50704.1 HEXXH motif-containing putative peptide modification protein [Acinetobacter sp. C26G]